MGRFPGVPPHRGLHLNDLAGPVSDEPYRGGPGSPWRALALLSGAVLLAMSPWFTAAAAGDLLTLRLGLTTGQLSALTGAVQVGFVVGTLVAAVLNLADLVPGRWYFGVSALLAALSNTLLLAATSPELLLLLRGATGFFLAGVYPPAMKMAATWFRASRGMAIGAVVGALTLGKAAPYLLRAGGGVEEGMTWVIQGASLAAVMGGLLILTAYRDGPYPFPRRAFRWGLVATVVRHRETRLATVGYLGHMWELYAMWTAIPLFFAAHFAGRVNDPGGAAALVTFAVVGVGALGSLAAGVLADRLGRERIAGGAMACSGGVALLLGWLLNAPTLLLVLLALFWGVTVVADSAQFSALVTELAPQDAAGTALTLQTSMGFLLTTVTIQGVPQVATSVGWGWAFALLVPGPVVGIVAMHRLAAFRREGGPAG